jgi:hypothetical protein
MPMYQQKIGCNMYVKHQETWK